MPVKTIDPVIDAHLLSAMNAHINPDPTVAADRTGSGQAVCDLKNDLNFEMKPS